MSKTDDSRCFVLFFHLSVTDSLASPLQHLAVLIPLLLTYSEMSCYGCSPCQLVVAIREILHDHSVMARLLNQLIVGSLPFRLAFPETSHLVF